MVCYGIFCTGQLLTWQIEYSIDPDNSNPRCKLDLFFAFLHSPSCRGSTVATK